MSAVDATTETEHNARHHLLTKLEQLQDLTRDDLARTRMDLTVSDRAITHAATAAAEAAQIWDATKAAKRRATMEADRT